MKLLNTLLILILAISLVHAQVNTGKVDLNYYLSSNIKYDIKIPSPEQYFGFQIGEWHLRHDQILAYLKELSSLSDRITYETYAYSYENRELILLTITSPENQQNIESLRIEHNKLSDLKISGNVNVEEIPLVVWMGYSVHGDEASGGNASVLVAYYLAAAQGDEINKLLENNLILIDPVLNPDGFGRFAQWVNMHKSKNLISDGASREHNQPFPSGRTSHYWFDLNRDWLPSQFPESQGRLRMFHKWNPNILTDHHEMGSNSTFFFQPGVPERTNPNTPQKNQDLTGKIAQFHAEALDNIGVEYYSKENFDDFYYGKGSTYPDVNGCIGILFEQASARGHLQESVNGLLSFPFAIKNQVTVSFSTLEAAMNLKTELLNFQRNFYAESGNLAAQDNVKGYVFGDENKKTETEKLVELLNRHQIDVFKLKTNYEDFQTDNSFVVPLNQPKYRLIKTMFETVSNFKDSIFYDVSSWTFPYAYGVKYDEITSNISYLMGDSGLNYTVGGVKKAKVSKRHEFVEKPNAAAYLIDWKDYYAPALLYELQSNRILTKVSTKKFRVNEPGLKKEFNEGTIIIPSGRNEFQINEITRILKEYSGKYGINVYSVLNGLTDGVNLGSPSIDALQKPEILIPVGDGVSQYSTGEVWHLLDQRYNIEAVLAEMEIINYSDLSRYNTIILPDGNFKGINKQGVEKLSQWLNGGGTLITIGGSISYAKKNNLLKIKSRSDPKDSNSVVRRPYGKRGTDYGSDVIGGAIFRGIMDLTHPLCYGYSDKEIALFKSSKAAYEFSDNPYATPVIYSNDPLISGYSSEKNIKMISESAAVLVDRKGRGRVIALVDRPNFRDFWYGTNRILINAVFFGGIIN